MRGPPPCRSVASRRTAVDGLSRYLGQVKHQCRTGGVSKGHQEWCHSYAKCAIDVPSHLVKSRRWGTETGAEGPSESRSGAVASDVALWIGTAALMRLKSASDLVLIGLGSVTHELEAFSVKEQSWQLERCNSGQITMQAPINLIRRSLRAPEQQPVNARGAERTSRGPHRGEWSHSGRRPGCRDGHGWPGIRFPWAGSTRCC